MSKLIANWELDTKTRNDKIRSIIKLINQSKKIFLKNPELSLAVNHLAIQNARQLDITCDDFLLYLLAHGTNDAAKYHDLKSFVNDFFEKTLPIIFKNFNSFQIGQNDYINVISTNQISLLYLENIPETSVFLIDNLKLEPFCYSEKEIQMVKRLISFVNSHNNNHKTLIMNFFSFYFFSINNNQKALAIQPRLIEKISDKLSSQTLKMNSINYQVLLNKIKSK